MQSIGERLEEARKRKGISLREAAEATKIRSDFLGNIEQNKFDFELPEIYKRGFIKNYARYLKLDPESIITDYNAHLLSKTRTGKKGAELFGSMEVKHAPSEETDEQDNEPSYGRISAKPPTPEVEDEEHHEADSDKIFYIKAGLAAVGTLALIFVVFGLIKAIMSSDDDTDLATSEQTTPPAVTQTVENTEPPLNGGSAASSTEDSITLIATGNVFVAVKQKNDGQMLFQKTLSGGESVTLTKEGPVVILFTAGGNLVVENPQGEKIRPELDGQGKMTVQ
jgi:transcriptional regulator with XRE-family HTH domain